MRGPRRRAGTGSAGTIAALTIAALTLVAGLLSGCSGSGSASGTGGRTGTGPGEADSGRASDGADPPARSTPGTRDQAQTPLPAPSGAAFYRPADPLPAGEPGDPLWSREIPATGELAAAGATVFQVMYHSTDALGGRAAVSGLVLLPRDAGSATPVVGYAPGTQGLGDDCAPSRVLAGRGGLPTGDIVAVLRAGWAVAVTDYPGLGTPGEHSYAVGQVEGRALLDVVRAATRLPGAGLSATAQVALTGYSQGGGAAVWAGELAPSYAPDLDIVGIAAGGVPADLAAVGRALDGSAYAGLALAAAAGLDAAYPELDLDRYLTDSGRAELAGIRGECAVQLVTNHGGQRVADITTTDPRDTTAWRRRLDENTLGSTSPEVPVYLYHAMSDRVVAYPQGENLRDTYCAAGVAVTWRPFPGDHLDGATQSPGAIAYLRDRFAGRPTSGDC